MFLSILIPSNRPEGLDEFLESLYHTAFNLEDIEIIVLVDDDSRPEYVTYEGNLITIHRPPTEPLMIGKLQEECYKLSTGDWILLANDDVTIETQDWDEILRNKVPSDGIGLLWPNDGMFGEKLSCFPIVSRKVLDLVKFFPVPYRRYKIDDTLYAIMPASRRKYIPEILFTHHNDKGTDGFVLDDGRIYPIDRTAADFDNLEWVNQRTKRANSKMLLEGSIMTVGSKVLIGVPTAEMGRRADFYDYFNSMDKPEGSVISFVHGQSPARNRNIIVEQAIEHACTHILFIDDDTAFKPDLLTRLMSHDKDIVTALYLMRNYPHAPIIFDKADENGLCRTHYLSTENDELIPVVAAGMGACLIRTDVFSKLEKPWFRLGELESDQWCDDLGFFKRVREAEIKIFCDMGARVGHIASMILWPNKIEGQWFTTYDTAGEGTASVPQLIRKENGTT